MAATKMKDTKPLFKKKRNNYIRTLKRKRLFEYLKDELHSCTTHGLPFIVNSEIHWLERLIWTATFVGSLFFAQILLSAQYDRYIKAPTVMSVEMDYFNWNVTYPAITLCPKQKIDEQQLNYVVEAYEASSQLNLSVIFRAIALSTLETIEILSNEATVVEDIDLFNKILPPNNYAKLAAAIFIKFDNYSMTTNTDSTISVDAVMTEMGMCHIINSNVAIFNDPNKWDAQDGVTKPQGNSKIEVSVHDRDSSILIMRYAQEFEVYIHNPDEIIQISSATPYVFDKEGSMLLEAQVWTTKISNELRHSPLELRKCRSTRAYSYFFCVPTLDAVSRETLHRHWREVFEACAKGAQPEEERTSSRALQLELEPRLEVATLLTTQNLTGRAEKLTDESENSRYLIYSYNHCIMQCRIKMILQLCGCIPHFYKPLDHEKVCNIKELSCIVEHLNEIKIISVTSDTARKFEDASLPTSPRNCNCLNDCETDVYKIHDSFVSQENINRLQVGLYSFPKVRVVRDIIYSYYDLVLKLGGTVNLCIGTSFISVMELIMTLIRIPIHEFYKIIHIKFMQRNIAIIRKEK